MSYETLTARIYDLYFPADRGPEASRWADIAGPLAAELLEPMVGTAEVATLLARDGFRVTGVDTSPAMLEVARRRLAAEPAQVTSRVSLIHADIACVHLPSRRFDLAYVGNGSWHLLTERAARLASLSNIRGSLRPGGKLALELFDSITRTATSERRAAILHYAPPLTACPCARRPQLPAMPRHRRCT